MAKTATALKRKVKRACNGCLLALPNAVLKSMV